MNAPCNSCRNARIPMKTGRICSLERGMGLSSQCLIIESKMYSPIVFSGHLRTINGHNGIRDTYRSVKESRCGQTFASWIDICECFWDRTLFCDIVHGQTLIKVGWRRGSRNDAGDISTGKFARLNGLWCLNASIWPDFGHTDLVPGDFAECVASDTPIDPVDGRV